MAGFGLPPGFALQDLLSKSDTGAGASEVRQLGTLGHTLREASQVHGVDVVRESGGFGVWQLLNQV